MPTGSSKLKAVRPFNGLSQKIEHTALNNWRRPFQTLSIEIGCGVGLHPIQWTGHNPKGAMLAFERTKNKFASLQRRKNNHDRENLWIENHDAFDWIPKHIGTDEVDEYILLYPNPYPKEKQANKRWYRAPFCHYLITTLKNGGKIHFATNETFLYEECLQYAKEYWRLDRIKNLTSQAQPWEPRTHFEKKYLARGETLYDVTFRKTPESRTSSPSPGNDHTHHRRVQRL